MKKIMDFIPCVSVIGLVVYLVEDFFESKKEEEVA